MWYYGANLYVKGLEFTLQDDAITIDDNSLRLEGSTGSNAVSATQIGGETVFSYFSFCCFLLVFSNFSKHLVVKL